MSYSLPTSRFINFLNEVNAETVVFDVVVSKGKGSVENMWFHGPKKYNEVGPLITCSEQALRWARVSEVDMWIRDIPDGLDVIRLECD